MSDVARASAASEYLPYPSNATHLPIRLMISVLAAVVAFVSSAQDARAVPAFAVQTGQPCTTCHVGGFGPQLTPFGRTFKLEGYTMRAGTDFTLPVSAMVMASYVHTAEAQPSAPAPHYAPNDNTTLDQASVFVGGGIGDHFGGLAQITYDGVGRAVSWDNLDIRAVTHTTIAGDDVLLGVSLNNNPGVEDVWNTLPAWGFPYTSSDLSPAPAAATVFDGGLAQSVLGVNVYAYWNSAVYAEAGVYWTPPRGFLRAMGADAYEGGPVLSDATPYFRVAYQKDYGDQNFEVGAFGLFPRLEPGGISGTPDNYSDVGLDASYQFIGDSSSIYSINAIYTHEGQDLAGSQPMGASANLHNTLNDIRFDASYYWHNVIGGTVQPFNTWGSGDSLLYAGNRTLSPNSQGVLFQVDGTPFGAEPSFLGPRVNIRVGLQYTAYSLFDGASHNYDGLGHNASDNNTFRIFAWLAF
jgi:hypothetical protein